MGRHIQRRRERGIWRKEKVYQNLMEPDLFLEDQVSFQQHTVSAAFSGSIMHTADKGQPRWKIPLNPERPGNSGAAIP